MKETHRYKRFVPMLFVLVVNQAIIATLSIYILSDLLSCNSKLQQKFQLLLKTYDLQWSIGRDAISRNTAAELGYERPATEAFEQRLAGYKSRCEQICTAAQGLDPELRHSMRECKSKIEKYQQSGEHTREAQNQFALMLLDSFSNLQNKIGNSTKRSADLLLFALAAIVPGSAIIMLQFYQKHVSRPLKQLAEIPLSPGGTGQSNAMQNDVEFAAVLQALQNARTEVGKSNSEEQKMIENSGVFICSLNRKGEFDFANSASEKIVGLQPFELKGKRVEDLVIEDDQQILIDCLQKSWHKETTFELRLRHLDGSIVHSRWSMTYVRNEHRLFCTVQDVTDEKTAQAMLQENTSIICQDIHAPLMKMKELLAQQIKVLKAENHIDAEQEITGVQSIADNLIKLAEELYALPSLDKNVTLHRGHHDLRSIILESLRLITGQALNKEIQIDLSDEPLLDLYCDRTRIVQVFVNLLSNALKFSPARTRISIGVSEKNAAPEELGTPSGTVEISISDAGPGIPQEQSDSIFEPFKQISTRQTGGYGLGLSICKMIIEAHGGTIGVRSLSKYGQETQNSVGSTFWFRIPQADKSSYE